MDNFLDRLSKNRISRYHRFNEDILATDPVSVFEPIVIGTYSRNDLQTITNAVARYNSSRSDATPNFPELVLVNDADDSTDEVRVMVRVMSATNLTNQEITLIMKFLFDSSNVSAITESLVDIKYVDDLKKILEAEDIYRVTPYPEGDFSALVKNAKIAFVSNEPVTGTLYLQDKRLFFVTDTGDLVDYKNPIRSTDDVAVAINPIAKGFI